MPETTVNQAEEKPVPFAPIPEKLSVINQKQVDSEKAYEEYRSKVSLETGRPLASFGQLDEGSRAEFSDTGKLLAVESGPYPQGIHVVRNVNGFLVLVTHHNRPIYVVGDENLPDVVNSDLFSAILTKPKATPFGNFTIVDGAWAYKGRTLYTFRGDPVGVKPPWEEARIDGVIEPKETTNEQPK